MYVYQPTILAVNDGHNSVVVTASREAEVVDLSGLWSRTKSIFEAEGTLKLCFTREGREFFYGLIQLFG